MLFNILFLTFLSSIVSLIGGLLLLLKKTWTKSFSLTLTSFAAGVLLASAFLDLLPEAIENTKIVNNGEIFSSMLAGIILFFLLERTFIWFHHHHGSHGEKPTVWMLTIGDGLHNFIDGVAIAATFMINPAVGLTTALAVAAHEIPQEIADFGILLSQGMSKWRTLLFNIGSALSAFIGAFLTYLIARQLEPYLGLISAFTAGMFVYIALSDLIPELHHSDSRKDALPQVIAFITGIIVIFIIIKSIG